MGRGIYTSNFVNQLTSKGKIILFIYLIQIVIQLGYLMIHIKCKIPHYTITLLLLSLLLTFWIIFLLDYLCT